MPRTPTESSRILASVKNTTANREQGARPAACMDCVEFSALRLRYLPVYNGHFTLISTNAALEDRVGYRVCSKEVAKREGRPS